METFFSIFATDQVKVYDKLLVITRLTTISSPFVNFAPVFDLLNDK